MSVLPLPPVREAEQFTKPGTANVSPSDLAKLRPLMAHYAKMPHPFTSCKRDQIKHGLTEDHANRRCAVLKDLIRGTTKWRNNEELTEEEAALVGAYALGVLEDMEASLGEELVEELGLQEEALTSKARKSLPSSAFVFPKDRRYPIHNIGHARNALARSAGKPEEGTVRAAVHKKYPQLKKAKESELEVYAQLAEEVRELSEVAVAFDPKQHPRAAAGTPGGGKFITSGSTGTFRQSVIKKLGGSSFDKQDIRKYQRRNDLLVDGKIGSQTAASLLGIKPRAPGELTAGLKQRLSAVTGGAKVTRGSSAKRTGSRKA